MECSHGVSWAASNVFKRQYLSSQVIRANNEEIFGIFIPARQYTRNVIEYDVVNENPDSIQQFVNELYGFELAYRPKMSNTWMYIPGLTDGNINQNGYNFNLDINRKTIGFTFNRNNKYWIPEIGSRIRIIIYTTEGPNGNFTIPNIFENYEGLSFEFAQDRSFSMQDALLKATPYLSMRDGLAVGGSTMKEFEDIRKMVILWGSNNKVLTPGEFERRAEIYKFKAVKVRDDVRCLEYKANGVLYDSDNKIIGATTKDLSFSFKDLPLITEVNHRLLTPKDIFILNDDTQKLEYFKKPADFNDADSYKEYIEKYQNNTEKNYMFPYHIKFIATNYLQVKVFNMNINLNRSVDFLYYNYKTVNPTSILSLNFFRDSINYDKTKLPVEMATSEVNGYLELTCNIFTDAIVCEQLYAGNKPVIYRIELINKINKMRFALDGYVNREDIDLTNNVVTVHFYLPTNDSYDDNDNLCIKNALQPLPFIDSFIDTYYLERNIDLKIFALQKNTVDNSYINTPYDYVVNKWYFFEVHIFLNQYFTQDYRYH